jgi:hypothetical protein
MPNTDVHAIAVAAGAVFFNTGAPCKNGHLSDRYTSTKTCVQCHKAAMAATKEKYSEREAERAARREAAKQAEREALRPQRDAAAKAYRAQWKKANKARSKAVNDVWRAENAEKMKATTLAWRKDHPDRTRAYVSAWAKRNPEKERARAVRRHERMSAEERRERRRKFHENNPDAIRRYNSDYKAKKMRNGGVLSKDIVARLLKVQRGKCACCGQPLGEQYHLDHILPLALGGPNVDSNVQLLRQRCNNQKRDKHPVDFMQSRGFLL